MRPETLELNNLLRAQAGVASLQQMLALGLNRSRIARRRRSGLDVAVFPGVVRSAGAPATWVSDVVAASLFLGERAVASGQLAARLHRLSGFESDTHIEFSTPTKSRGLGGRIQVHESRRLPAKDISLIELPLFERERRAEHVAGVPVLRCINATNPTRTIIDLAHRLSVPALARLVDSSIAARLTSTDQLLDRLAGLRGSGVKGVRKLDEVLIDAGVESWLERRFLELLRDHNLPRPQCQVVFREGTRFLARVDFLFDGTNVIVEVSGRRGHVTDAERRKDARRRNDLQRAGMVVLEFTTADVVDEPAYVARTIRDAIGR